MEQLLFWYRQDVHRSFQFKLTSTYDNSAHLTINSRTTLLIFSPHILCLREFQLFQPSTATLIQEVTNALETL